MVKDLTEKIECACGKCHTMILRYDANYRERKYVIGHNARVPGFNPDHGEHMKAVWKTEAGDRLREKRADPEYREKMRDIKTKLWASLKSTTSGRKLIEERGEKISEKLSGREITWQDKINATKEKNKQKE